MAHQYLKTQPDEKGFFGEFGGSFIPPELQKEMDAITDAYYSISKSHDFITELRAIRKHFQGRPTPTYFCRNLSNKVPFANRPSGPKPAAIRRDR